MKTIVLLLSLILSLLVCKGQSLVQEGKLWSNTSIGTMPGSSYQSYFIKFMGDTTINGLAYKKIMKSMDELNANWSSFGYIREETTTRKIFIYNKAGNKDILLYDFSLEEGDSILTGDGHSYAKVTKVDNAVFGNSTVIRKQIYFFDASGNTRWIEGVGSTWGILEGLNSFFTTGASASLVCYSENDQMVYHNPKFINCFPIRSDRLIVNAGNDTTYCSDPNTTAIPMGIKVKIQNGVAPYTYAWECKIIPYGIFPPQTASDILNDSTLQSPTLTQSVWLETERIKFILHVTDSAGKTGKDSIRVAFSNWASIQGYQVIVISKGDSVLFNAGVPQGRVASYSWTPREGLSTPNNSATWCKPDVSTDYYSVLVDTSGCTASNLAYQIRVNPERPEFAPIGAEWYYSQYESYNPPQANYIKHTSIKDSIINGKPVKVIQKTRYQRSGATPLGYEYIYQHGDTIFYWKNKDFHVLYNFSLAKGDSMMLYSEMPDYCATKNPYGWVEIGSVQTTTINNHVLKAYSVTAKKGSKWDFGIHPVIEKIGSLTYLLPQNTDCIIDVPAIGLLRCYSDPELGFFHYQYEDFSCDAITTFPDGVNIYGRSLNLKIYPNPVFNNLYIEGNFNERDYTLELYSINGELIKTECLDGGIDRYSMDAKTLKSGSYILRVVSEKGKFTEQVIIKK